MIRRATVEDIPALVVMAREFHAHSSDAAVRFDEANAATFFETLIGSETACVFIDPDGFICGVVTTMPCLVQSFTVAHECLLWARKSGSELFDAFEAWARKSGANRLIVSHRHSDKTPAFERLFRMRGYQPFEHYYVRAI